ncbi:hypothetical protein ACIBKX_12875 [Streptomyces sp. NPDC050658]
MRQMECQRSDGEGVGTPAASRYVDTTGVRDVGLGVLGAHGRRYL